MSEKVKNKQLLKVTPSDCLFFCMTNMGNVLIHYLNKKCMNEGNTCACFCPEVPVRCLVTSL